MKEFFDEAVWQNHPLRILQQFLKDEDTNKQAKKIDDMRFVGYALEIGYDTVTIITSDPYKIAVGGVPRNSLLVMLPSDTNGIPPHFVLLRVLETAPTPLSEEVAQTYFELQKKSMPELDVFTQSELQWGALKTTILGMFYPSPDKSDEVEFSADINNFVSAHKYLVYSPTDDLLNLIVNEMVPKINQFAIGKLRLTECRLPLPGKKQPDVNVYVSTKDFMGTRTAMFGKTRLGKSNNVKIIAQSLIETTKSTNNVGQLIFDIDGEYANDNPQDDNSSLASAYPDRCQVYALNPKPATPSKPLKLNFYEHPNASHRILAELLKENDRDSAYVSNFAEVDLPILEELDQMDRGEKLRAVRRILMYWAILKKAGFDVNEDTLKKKLKEGFNPGYNNNLRQAAYQRVQRTPPNQINTLSELVTELEFIGAFVRLNPNNPLLNSTSSDDPLFEADEKALLKFLNPPAGVGPAFLQPFRKYHDKNAGDFIKEILKLLDAGKTVILDLSNANEEVRNYFSDKLTDAVFRHQGDKFSNNELEDHYVQLYFEEAHNLFPSNEEEATDIYRRVAKEGAKYHIGMVYSTQSVTTISGDLLKQTENFFISHLSSQEEVNALAKLQVAFETMKDDILNAKTVGYVRMLTRSHRFVIPVQTAKFAPPANAKKVVAAAPKKK